MSRRDEMRQRRHAEILTAASAIIAERGFHQTRLEDVGAAIGVSGPALYRYFKGKDDLLAQILIDTSVRVLELARGVFADGEDKGWSAEMILRTLLENHVDFAVTEPDRIRVQEREIRNLPQREGNEVRSLQRIYIGMWVQALRAYRPSLSEAEARVQVQLAAGMINSSRHILRWAGPDAVREHTMEMTLKAMEIEPVLGRVA